MLEGYTTRALCTYRNITAPSRPSQAKVLTEGGDLREARVDIPLSVIHSCV